VSNAARSRAAPEPEASDARLFERIQAGDVGALGVLFDRHAVALRRVMARLGVSACDIDDLVQATFLDVLAAAGSYDGRASARPWLVGMAVMQVRRHRRSIGRLVARLASWASEPLPEPETPDLAAEAGQVARRAQAAIARLSQKKREVFVLVALEGLGGEEVGRTLGIPVATVWTRLHHARLELREALCREDR
jgi:RNA polymerase sigma-70 factor, ECF subfamily